MTSKIVRDEPTKSLNIYSSPRLSSTVAGDINSRKVTAKRSRGKVIVKKPPPKPKKSDRFPNTIGQTKKVIVRKNVGTQEAKLAAKPSVVKPRAAKPSAGKPVDISQKSEITSRSAAEESPTPKTVPRDVKTTSKSKTVSGNTKKGCGCR